jgi:hypothetical protein
MKKKVVAYLGSAFLALLFVFIISDLFLIFKDLCHQTKHPIEYFLPGHNSLILFLFFVFVAFILQFILFEFLFNIEKFLKYLLIIIGISILIFGCDIFSKQIYNSCLVLSASFFLYSIFNYLIYKKVILAMG